MAISAVDRFDRADAYDLGEDWRIVYGFPRLVDHAVVCAAASPSATELIAIHTDELDAVEHMARARFRIEGNADDDAVRLYARAELSESGGEWLLLKGYCAELTRAGVLTLYSITESEPAPVQVAQADVELDGQTTHIFAMKVREHYRGTQIDIFIDNDVIPIMHFVNYADRRPDGKAVGFGLFDQTLSGNVSAMEFNSYILKSSFIKPVRPPVRLLTFQDIIYQCQYRLDRSGNSQFDENVMGDFVNFAYDEVYNELTPWKWAFRQEVVTVPAGTRYIEFPAYVSMLYDAVDMTLGYQLSKVMPMDINATDPDKADTGGPYRLAVVANGDNGGLVAELNPVPQSDLAFMYQFYARPTPLTEPGDIPFIPSNWLEVLVFGALKRGSMSDTDTAFMQANNMSWERMMNRMKRQNYLDLKTMPRLRTANEMFHEKAGTRFGPLTRAAQLGV